MVLRGALSATVIRLTLAVWSAQALALSPRQDVSGCMLDCITGTSLPTQCQGFTDLQCVCDNSEFLQATLQCIQWRCPQSDVQQAKNLYNIDCESSVVSGGTPAPTAVSELQVTVTVTAPSNPAAVSPSPAASSPSQATITTGESSLASSSPSAVDSPTTSPAPPFAVPSYSLSTSGSESVLPLWPGPSYPPSPSGPSTGSASPPMSASTNTFSGTTLTVPPSSTTTPLAAPPAPVDSGIPSAAAPSESHKTNAGGRTRAGLGKSVAGALGTCVAVVFAIGSGKFLL